jgi:hypothetical protein
VACEYMHIVNALQFSFWARISDNWEFTKLCSNAFACTLKPCNPLARLTSFQPVHNGLHILLELKLLTNYLLTSKS